MRSRTYRLHITVLVAFLFIAVIPVSDSIAQISASYKYNLADFSGTVPYMHAILAKDSIRREVYVMSPKDRDIRIFGETGMETYRFGEGREFDWAVDLAVSEKGDIYFLRRSSGTIVITRCNYRGELQSDIRIKGIPDEYSGISPVYMEIVKEKVYLADPMGFTIIVSDLKGNFQKGYNVEEMIHELEEADREARKKKDARETVTEPMTSDITGFNVDRLGNMYFTIASEFAAFRLSPDGELKGWGKPGSVPGSFGVASGIAADDLGFIYVTDKLRSVVMIFDSAFNFITEFGFRGLGPSNLIVPNEIVVGRDGRIFVAQAANRGVSVFAASYSRSVQ